MKSFIVKLNLQHKLLYVAMKTWLMIHVLTERIQSILILKEFQIPDFQTKH